MKKFIILLYVFFKLHSLSAQNVVINEVMYDPSGSDSGYEWIELYNPNLSMVNLMNWKIQKAGTSFSNVFTFSEIMIGSGCFLLIGETNIENADIITTLGFQNGGSATDGIRLVSADELYTDTILYDSPNSNDLEDDTGNIGDIFAPDVSGGNTLARKKDGEDTDNCEIDWFECSNPTPGEQNFYPVDLAVDSLEITQFEGIYWVNIWVVNLSTEYVHNSASSVQIAVNEGFWAEFNLPEIYPGEIININIELGSFEQGIYIVGVNLNYFYDIELDNNSSNSSFLVGSSPIVFNEIMFKPEEDAPEWIELYNYSECGYYVDNFVIFDASGGEIRFSGEIESLDYLVVTENKELLLEQYPSAPVDKIITAESWTALNNTDEILELVDIYGTDYETIEYTGEDSQTDVSLERINPYLLSELCNWGYSIRGATPGQRNSIYVVYLPENVKLSVKPNPFSPTRGERTILSFKLPEKLSTVTMRVFDLKGRMIKRLVDQTPQAAEGEIIWDGKDDTKKFLPVGIYLVLMEATSLESEKVYSQTETIIIGK